MSSVDRSRAAELAPPSSSSRRSPLLVWLVGVAMCAAVVGVAGHFADLRGVLRTARELTPGALLIAVALQLATYASQGAIWRVVGYQARTQVSALFAFELSIAELFVDQALPTGGISGTAFAAQALEQRGYPRAWVAAGVVARSLAYYAGYAFTLAIALLLTFTIEPWGAGYFRAATMLFLVVSVAIVAVLYGASGIGLSQRLPRLSRIAAVRRVLVFLDAASPALVRSIRVLSAVTSFQALNVLLDAATMYCLVRTLGGQLSAAAVFTSYMLASVFRSIGIAPGGLGSFEAASVLTLSAAGASVPVALSATMLFRALSFWLPMIPGFWLSRRVSRKHGHEVRSV